MNPPKIKLPAQFQFSQGSLQAYVDCPRLFQLRYIERLSWPAPEVEPALENERNMQLGSDFHRLVHQFVLGVPNERLEAIANQDTILSHWWQNFLEDSPKLDGYAKYSEKTLSTPIGEYRLGAKFDLIALSTSKPIEFKIFDWKTSRNLPKSEWQEKKLQSKVYPYLLMKAGSFLNDGMNISPDQIEMIYWFSNFPSAPIRIEYNQTKFDMDHKEISDLIEEISSLKAVEVPKTENTKRCRFCVYRSLCNRGISAASLDELDIDQEEDLDSNFTLDFDQITEIEF